MRLLNPSTVAEPASVYSHGVEVSNPSKILFLSGQIGVTPDGRLGSDIEAQADLCWKNIHALLAEAGMDERNVVKVSTFVTRQEYVDAARTSRAAALGAWKPAATIVVVAGLPSPDLLIEVEVVAAM